MTHLTPNRAPAECASAPVVVARIGSFVVETGHPEAPFVVVKANNRGRVPRGPLGGAPTLDEALVLVEEAGNDGR